MTTIPDIGDVIHDEQTIMRGSYKKPPQLSDVDLPIEYFDSKPDVQKWMNKQLGEAMAMNASDFLMVFKADDLQLTVSIRVDGKMRPLRYVEGPETMQIMGLFRNKAELATGGSFAPESALYPVPMGNGEVRSGRVASFKTADNGTAIVMRLPPKGEPRPLSELSFSQKNLDLFKDLLSQSNRMTMIAGPMGSGKTTTATGALLHVAGGTRTVWTIEDPVEHKLPGIVQLEVDEDNDAGFDTLLPQLLRADYDTLFLGEIRDKATAAAGVRQAKAGRQVITTIHANDNITAILRLIELAEDSPLSVLDSVRGVVSQRLIGRLNPSWDGHNKFDKYRGRVPIHEVLTVTDEIIEAVMGNVPLTEVRTIAAKSSKSTFREDAERLVNSGITDEEEIRRVLGEY